MNFGGGSPVLSEETYDSLPASRTGVMTIGGAMGKLGLLLLIVLGIGSFSWKLAASGSAAGPVLVWGGLIGGLGTAFVTAFKKEWSPVTAPLYAAFKGCLLGWISATYAQAYEGIVVQAVTLTLAVAVSMLALYTMRVIQPTARFRAIVFSATAGVMLFYLVALVLGAFGVQVPLIHSSGWFGIGFSLFVVGLAALNLVIDFQLIETGAQRGAPKFMEWYGAFAVLVTLVWLYIEVLRLLAKLRSRD